MTGTELKALIFDVDGTLTDNECDGHRVAFNRAFEEAGLDWNWDVPTYLHLLEVFGGKERVRHYIEDYLDGFEPPGDLDDYIRGLHKLKTGHYLALLKSGALPLRPGVARLVKEAKKAGLKLAIASTTTLDNALLLIKVSFGERGLDLFDVIACGDVVANKKPAPDIYNYTLDKLGLAADECLVIEDTEAGLAAAGAAGLTTVITVNEATKGQDFNGAAIVLDHLGEPDRAFNVLAGDAGGARLVDIALLRRLHAEAL